jgi:hypothetical protein
MVTGGQSYNLNWDDGLEGSGSYDLFIKASACQSDRVTTYDKNMVYGYSAAHTRVITVPLGQSQVYIFVKSYFNGDTGTFALKFAPKPPSGGLIVTVD